MSGSAHCLMPQEPCFRAVWSLPHGKVYGSGSREPDPLLVSRISSVSRGFLAAGKETFLEKCLRFTGPRAVY